MENLVSPEHLAHFWRNFLSEETKSQVREWGREGHLWAKILGNYYLLLADGETPETILDTAPMERLSNMMGENLADGYDCYLYELLEGELNQYLREMEPLQWERYQTQMELYDQLTYEDAPDLVTIYVRGLSLYRHGGNHLGHDPFDIQSHPTFEVNISSRMEHHQFYHFLVNYVISELVPKSN